MTQTIAELMQAQVGADFRLVNAYTNSKATPIEAACASLLYGVELEIENANSAWRHGGITVTTDNSLRNDGYEYVTQPCTISVLNHVLRGFFERYPCDTATSYSDRTSVHVHANCQDLTLEQLSTVLLLYQVFEDLLFEFAGGGRDKNIYCVPWSQTSLSYNFVNRVMKGVTTVRNWQKYTALNVLPIWSQGTVEFRHMGGTNDVNKIINWCQLIGCLFEYAKKISLADTKRMFLELNTNSAYSNAIDTVFRQWAQLLKCSNYEILMETGVVNMKYMLAESDAVKKAANPLLSTAPEFNPQSVYSPDRARFSTRPRDTGTSVTPEIQAAYNEAALRFDEIMRLRDVPVRTRATATIRTDIEGN